MSPPVRHLSLSFIPKLLAYSFDGRTDTQTDIWGDRHKKNQKVLMVCYLLLRSPMFKVQAHCSDGPSTQPQTHRHTHSDLPVNWCAPTLQKQTQSHLQLPSTHSGTFRLELAYSDCMPTAHSSRQTTRHILNKLRSHTVLPSALNSYAQMACPETHGSGIYLDVFHLHAGVLVGQRALAPGRVGV